MDRIGFFRCQRVKLIWSRIRGMGVDAADHFSRRVYAATSLVELERTATCMIGSRSRQNLPSLFTACAKYYSS